MVKTFFSIYVFVLQMENKVTLRRWRTTICFNHGTAPEK